MCPRVTAAPEKDRTMPAARTIPLPTLSEPILSLRQLRKAAGGASRLKGLNVRNPYDRLDILMACAMIAAVEAYDQHTFRAAQAIGWYGKTRPRGRCWPLLHLSAGEVLEVLVLLAPQATNSEEAKRQICAWAEQEERLREKRWALADAARMPLRLWCHRMQLPFVALPGPTWIGFSRSSCSVRRQLNRRRKMPPWSDDIRHAEPGWGQCTPHFC